MTGRHLGLQEMGHQLLSEIWAFLSLSSPAQGQMGLEVPQQLHFSFCSEPKQRERYPSCIATNPAAPQGSESQKNPGNTNIWSFSCLTWLIHHPKGKKKESELFD